MAITKNKGRQSPIEAYVDIGFADPARYENNGWLDFNKFTWKNREYAQYGVAARENYAIQLGIGLPF